MRAAIILRASLAALLFLALPTPSFAQVYLDIQIGTPPPAIPYYYQPPVPAPNYIWTPGYWAWGPGGYFWVPGTWIQPPQYGLVWTPGYWGWTGYGFGWNNGYWSNQVGYYGGVNYGNGYYGPDTPEANGKAISTNTIPTSRT